MTTKASPLAVLISDVHFTPATLDLASAAFSAALRHAESLGVPLVDCGDVMDTKAIMRAECVNELIRIVKDAKTRVIFLNGNHTLLNEKSQEHSLHFLRPYCDVIGSALYDLVLGVHFIPYQTNVEALSACLNKISPGATILAHQGVKTAYLGHYVQDNTSLEPERFADFRVISGHYHRRQDIKCGRPRRGAVGLFSYIGNPYTLTFGEANDPEKGYQVLYDDGLLEFVPTNLRRHRIFEATPENYTTPVSAASDDLVWVKLRGPSMWLDGLKKSDIAETLGLAGRDFKLDKIPDADEVDASPAKDQTPWEVLDSLIDRTAEAADDKTYLKQLSREVLDETA